MSVNTRRVGLIRACQKLSTTLVQDSFEFLTHRKKKLKMNLHLVKSLNVVKEDAVKGQYFVSFRKYIVLFVQNR